MNYDDLCEMDLGALLGSMIGGNKQGQPEPSGCGCKLDKPIQPTDNVGEFGNETQIHIKVAEDGGLEIDSKEMAVKLSSDVFEAIKAFIKGE